MKQLGLLLLAGFAAFALIAAGSSPKQAAVRSAATIKATVLSDCTVQSPQVVDFGTYDPSTNATVDVTADALQIACTKGAPGVTIALDNGQYYTGSHRAMRSIGGTGAVYYEIYTTSSRQVIWNRTQTVTYTVTSRQPATIQLFGRVLGTQSPAPGDYSDTLMALLNF